MKYQKTHSIIQLQQIRSEQHKVYLVCFNPHCLKDKQRCLTTNNLHSHPKECIEFYYPADQIIAKHWTQLEKYPIDNLGLAVKKKNINESEKGFVSKSIENLQRKFQASLKQLQQKMLQLFPQKELERCYNTVYNLDKISECLKLRKNPTYISGLISQNFSAHNYYVLLRLNQSYDEIKNTIDSLNTKLVQNFDAILKKQKSNQVAIQNKRVVHKKINYGVYKSKFIASSKIEFNKSVITFPKINNIASFLPWIYTDKHFNEGIHEFKISSLKYPLVQNTGFTVLQEHDIDTYPYTNFKSLFNRQGKGFKLIKGEEIDQFVAQTTVVVLRIQLGSSPKAMIYDSQLKCYYECPLKQQTTYRMGVYGCGWTMEVIELN